jgi:hypothetical protein
LRQVSQADGEGGEIRLIDGACRPGARIGTVDLDGDVGDEEPRRRRSAAMKRSRRLGACR